MTDNKRKFDRIPCSLVASIKDRRGTTELQTTNVSLHGVHLITEHPHPVRELVQLAFDLGGFGQVKVMGMVAWRMRPDETPEGMLPGMGVEFFALSREDKDRWTDFVLQLVAASAPEEPVVPPAGTKPLEGQPPLRRRHPRFISCFLVQMKSTDRLMDLYTRDISVGGMFLRTPVPSRVHLEVQLVLVHPSTKEEFHLTGRVVRVQIEGSPEERGVGISFDPLPPAREAMLLAFIESGVNFLESLESRDLSRGALIRKAMEMVAGSPDAMLMLGRILLKARDAGEATEAFKRVLALAPDHEAAREGLQQAYLMLGDDGSG